MSYSFCHHCPRPGFFHDAQGRPACPDHAADAPQLERRPGLFPKRKAAKRPPIEERIRRDRHAQRTAGNR